MSLPYMPFWVGDYTKNTMHLNTLQHGAYLLLIFHLWSSNAPSNAPSNQQVIAKALLKHCPSICKMSQSEWDEIKDDVLEFFIIDGDYLISKRVSEQLTESNIKNINAIERARKAAEKRWGKSSDAPSNAPSIQQAFNEQCLDNANQNQSQIFNNSTNYINKEDMHSYTCEKLDFTDREVSRTDSTQIPTIETAKAWADYHFQKLDFDTWFKHWSSLGWIDSNGRPIKWQQKMAYNAKDKMFVKKTETTNKPQFKQPYDTDRSRATAMKVYDKLIAQGV